MFEIIPEYFYITLFISFLVLYLVAPEPKIVVKYPDIQNAESTLYVDDNNVCYRYKKKEITC